MRRWHLLRARLRSLLHRRASEADLDEELRLHLDQQIDHLVARGVPPDEARREALRQFGGVAHYADECRDARGTALLDTLLRDARQGARRLIRDWPFTAAAVAICALGIGANVAIFSFVNAALLRSQPFARERLVELFQRDSNPGGIDGCSFPAYLDMAAATDVFESAMATTVLLPVTYQDQGGVRRATVEYTTASYLRTLRLRLTAGRWFDAVEEENGAAPVAVIGHRTWMRRFGGDRSIVGRTIRIEGTPVTIVGIGPAAYNGTLNIGVVTDFWLPVSALRTFGGLPTALDRRPPESAFLVKARLRDGVTVAQAQAVMDNLGRRLAAEYPNEDPGRGIAVYPASDVRIHPQLDTVLESFAIVLFAVVALVLAVACSNVATLLLVRGAARARELSTRLALGATRRQLIRLLLTESLIVSLAGGAAGSLLAWWTLRFLQTRDLAIDFDVALDLPVLAFAAILSTVIGVAFGLMPALNATRIDLMSILRSDGDETAVSGRMRLKHGLVVAQVALSVLLLGAATVVMQAIGAAQSTHAGFSVDDVAMIETDARYTTLPADNRERLYDELQRRIAALPGVQAVAVTRGLPMEPSGMRIVVDTATGVEPPKVEAAALWASPGFFDLMRIPILYGRPLDERDRAGTPRAAVISESMARSYFGVVNAVGRRFRPEAELDGWIEVVGVARDTGTSDPMGDLVDPHPYLFYRSHVQWRVAPTAVVARTSAGAAPLVAAMQRELRGIDPQLPVIAAQTMRQSLERSRANIMMAALFLGVLGLIGLGLASIGLYAVVAFTVSRRSREIGIRMALGARQGRVVGDVARQVGVLVGVGTLVGLALSIVAVRALGAVAAPAPGVQLYVPSVDPLALTAIAALMAIVGSLAGFVPARRAARLDPAAALKRQA